MTIRPGNYLIDRFGLPSEYLRMSPENVRRDQLGGDHQGFEELLHRGC